MRALESVLPYVLLAILCLTVAFSGMPLNHDSALLLHCGRLILQGSTPYLGHVETSLHMAQYFHIPPVVIADITGLNLPTAFFIWVLALTSLSALLVLILSRSLRELGLEVTPWLLASSVALFSLWALSKGEFGQREHLFILLLLPYLLVRTARYSGYDRRNFLSLLTGLAAGAAILFKPTFPFVLLAFEIGLLFHTRRWRALLGIEALAVYSVLLVYPVHLLLLPEGLGSPFFVRWLPELVTRYRAYNCSMAELFHWNILQWVVTLTGIGSGLYYRRMLRGGPRLLIDGLLVATTMASLLFILQCKGWRYQLLPASGLALFLLSTMAVLVIRSRDEWLRTVLSLCMLATALTLSALVFQRSSTCYEDMNWFLSIIDEHTVPEDAVDFISSSVYPKYPTLIYAERWPSSRYTFCFPLSFQYLNAEHVADGRLYRSLDEMPEEELTFWLELGSDLQEGEPAMVFIQARENEQGLPRDFIIADYLDETGWMTRYLPGYHLVAEEHGYRAYIP